MHFCSGPPTHFYSGVDTFRKITNSLPQLGGFRTEWGARLYADIHSVIETARRRAIGALHAFRLTLQGLPLPAPAS
ncbi:MAG: hypothetical protein EXQ88_03870 [Alphaproteobacteria bacterium]|nr:hypothetical protein [Alphaproteobacteria bacterium]